MLTELVELAYEPSSEKRRLLLTGLADLFDTRRDAMTEHELAMFGEIVTRILRDVPNAAREELSNRMAHQAHTPHSVAMALASDDSLAVAAPILEHSPVLTEDDLIALAEAKAEGHRLAISRRSDLDVRITDALMRFNEGSVLVSLADNPGARISEPGFERMARHAESSKGLRDKLCLRCDQPIESARRILPYLEPEARSRLEALMAENGKPLTDLIQKAVPELAKAKLGRAKGRVQVKAMIADVEAGRASLDSVVAMLSEEERHMDAALAISEATLLPLKQVANAVLSTHSEPLALIAKASGLATATYLALDRLRCNQMKIAAPDPARSAAAYEAVDEAAAQRTLRFVKVRTNLLAAS